MGRFRFIFQEKKRLAAREGAEMTTDKVCLYCNHLRQKRDIFTDKILGYYCDEKHDWRNGQEVRHKISYPNNEVCKLFQEQWKFNGSISDLKL